MRHSLLMVVLCCGWCKDATFMVDGCAVLWVMQGCIIHGWWLRSVVGDAKMRHSLLMVALHCGWCKDASFIVDGCAVLWVMQGSILHGWWLCCVVGDAKMHHSLLMVALFVGDARMHPSWLMVALCCGWCKSFIVDGCAVLWVMHRCILHCWWLRCVVGDAKMRHSPLMVALCCGWCKDASFIVDGCAVLWLMQRCVIHCWWLRCVVGDAKMHHSLLMVVLCCGWCNCCPVWVLRRIFFWNYFSICRRPVKKRMIPTWSLQMIWQLKKYYLYCKGWLWCMLVTSTEPKYTTSKS